MAKIKSITFFDKHGRPTKEILDILFDAALQARFRTLQEYLEKEAYQFSLNDVKRLREKAENEIYAQVYYMAHLRFYIYEKSGRWGAPGEDQIKAAFCRNILQVSPLESLTYEHVSQFEAKVTDARRTLEIDQLTLDDAYEEYKEYILKLFNKEFVMAPDEGVNPILKFLGSGKLLQVDPHLGSYAYIFSEAEVHTVQELDVFFLNKELIRTPNFIMSNAALTRKRVVYLREEVLETLFYHKWMVMFANDEYVERQVRYNVFWNISQGIKKHVLSLYGASSAETLEQMKKQFIADMRETIVFHEIGHWVNKSGIIPTENIALAHGNANCSINLYNSFEELMADLAPKREKLRGALMNMARVGKKDRVRGERMFYMYLSDTWFYDTDDDYMYLYSDLIVLVLLRYINMDKSVNFDKLGRDLSFDADYKSRPRLSLYEKLVDIFVTDTNELMDIVKNAAYVFKDSNQTQSFGFLQKMHLHDAKKYSKNISPKSLDFLSPHWFNMFKYMEKFSPQYTDMMAFLENKKTALARKVMLASCDKETAKKYKNDYRRYIREKMVEFGILADISAVNR